MDREYIFEVYEDAKGEYRWRLKHRNGNIVADSSEGYKNRADCVNELDRITSAISEGDFDTV